MSMLSAQAEELRELARRINELQGGAVRAVTMPSNVGVTLRDAADTILSLRDRAQKLQAENTKLCELANGYEALTATLCNERECDGCPFDGTEQIVCEHMRLQTCLRELGVVK